MFRSFPLFLSAVRNQSLLCSLAQSKVWVLCWSSQPETGGPWPESQPSFPRAWCPQPLNLHRRKPLPSMASGCCQQGPNPAYPFPLTLKACSGAHCPLSGFVFNARALLGTYSWIPYPPSPLHFTRSLTSQEALKSHCWLPSSVQF